MNRKLSTSFTVSFVDRKIKYNGKLSADFKLSEAQQSPRG